MMNDAVDPVKLFRRKGLNQESGCTFRFLLQMVRDRRQDAFVDDDQVNRTYLKNSPEGQVSGELSVVSKTLLSQNHCEGDLAVICYTHK
jgi:hypothetical protein